MNHKFPLIGGALLLTAAFSLSSAHATLTLLTHSNSAQGDVLFVPPFAYELGENNNVAPEFTNATLISATFAGIVGFAPFAATPASLPATNGAAFDVVISIVNLSLNAWSDLWYIADANPAGGNPTVITNYDGLAGTSPNAPTLLTMRIDAVGANRPLVSESMTANGIFEIGETWQFILQDFTGDVAAFEMASVGLGDGASANPPGADPSSGSIVGTPVGQFIPEPSRALLLLVGVLSVVAARRRSA